jgi:hypothetical protein
VNNPLDIHLFRPRLRAWAVPLALLAVTLLAYAPLVPWLGYYQDDWYQVWFGRAFGAGIYPAYYARERPFIGWLYMLTVPIVGTAPLSWQVFALLARWLAGLSAWALLRRVLPGRPRLAFWTAVLFTVYPGFRQQYLAVIYSHYLLQLAFQLSMISLTLAAVRLAEPKRVLRAALYLVSLAGSAIGLLVSEYFFGVELLRPLALWCALGGEGVPWRQRLRRTAMSWLPFLGVLAAFLFWRIYIFRFPTYQPLYLQAGGSNLIELILRLAQTIAVDAAELGLYAWVLPLRMFNGLANSQPSALAALGLALAGLLLFLGLSRLIRKAGQSEPDAAENGASDRRTALGLALAGLAGLLAAGWPFWFVNLPVDTRLEVGSRFAISFIPGASLLAAGLLTGLVRPWKWRGLLLAVLAGLAVGHHFLDAVYYREVNQSQAIFYQQLAWRAPGLKPGTLVLTNTFQETTLMGDNSLTAALNWIYEASPPYRLDYMLFYLPERLQSGHLPALEPGLPFTKTFRTATFTGNTSNTLVIYYDYPRCLQVLDPALGDDLPRPVDMPREMRSAVALSNLDQIVTSPAAPASLPASLFKYRPAEDTWCYYYEKADLARQQQDWPAVAALADEAFSQNPKIATTMEALPFIEGYARAGRLEEARALTGQVWSARPDGRRMTEDLLCATWKRIGQTPGDNPSLAAYAEDVVARSGCR